MKYILTLVLTVVCGCSPGKWEYPDSVEYMDIVEVQRGFYDGYVGVVLDWKQDGPNEPYIYKVRLLAYYERGVSAKQVRLKEVGLPIEVWLRDNDLVFLVNFDPVILEKMPMPL